MIISDELGGKNLSIYDGSRNWPQTIWLYGDDPLEEYNFSFVCCCLGYVRTAHADMIAIYNNNQVRFMKDRTGTLGTEIQEI